MDQHYLSKLKRHLTKYRGIIRVLLVIAIFGAVTVTIFTSVRFIARLVGQLISGPATALSLFRNPGAVLRASKGRTNILLLGMGGANHEGPELTDSIIVVSTDLETADTAILSIPRDIWIDSLKTKINATYYFGEQKKTGGGLILTKAATEEVIGQPIHYAVAVDFDGFKQAIDLVGGIELNVPNNFDDYKYPIPGMETAEPEELRYEHLHFDAGIQKLSGERALKYVRSRNAEGEEGTDFARARRQQQVLTAFKDKVLSLDIIFSPSKLKELSQTFQDSIKTDLSEAEYISLAKLTLKVKDETIRSGVIEEEDEKMAKPGLLINPPPQNYNGQWVLVGRNNSWDEVHDYVNRFLNQFQ